ncbi:PREDICTED: kinesin-like protein KIN-UA isoform X2 [Ipomoea nil]|uniref:kinesin-like protein KIN-UA isoform X2 n=1 Tax=Ipomoea nil TaxID=35883 RepID=UPI000900A557|nr:PREDICTED: kinesin-like protein KIN-UA isoform X2 [Ipomoea nil]
MATASFRSGAVGRGGVKADTITSRTSSINSAPKSSFKSKSSAPPQNSGLRRNSTGSVATSTKERGGGRVRVAVRLRPRNAEEMVADADFADCVELQPELKRLNLRRNNWDTDTYEFDEVLTEFASQKRVYEAVAKPVVENVLDGYNGTVMAYGQTGTGKTYTLGRLGEEDTADRGIMLRAMEDILAEISLVTETVSVSYLQLYMESIQDLLDPANGNVSIVEDPKTGDVSLPGATVMEIRDQKSFLDLLQLGEAHRIAANTMLNTESSRSHAILMVHVKRSVKGRDSALSTEHGTSHLAKTFKQPVVRRSKLVVVDLAGSERISKSGSEAHTLEEAKSINLSLTALGKCINALAENSTHVPVRDSKLTRLLRDSFGGTARTSLVITIGPSPRHRGETASTIMFGKRAMKVENMLKTKEEFDYKGLSRRLDIQLDKLIAEHESQQKAFQDEIERIAQEAQKRIAEAERNQDELLESERMKYEKEYLDAIQKLEQQWETSQVKHDKVGANDSNNTEKFNQEPNSLGVTEDNAEIKRLLQNETILRKAAEEEISDLKNQIAQWQRSEAVRSTEILKLQKMLEDETHQKKRLEEQITILQNQLLQSNFEVDEARRNVDGGGTTELPSDLDSPLPLICQQLRDSEEEKASMEKLFEQVGLQKILSLLESEDADVRIHAIKVLANLAAEVTNQVKIVKAGGLTSLLAILRSSSDETIHRVAAGAIANLAMNETNQELIMSQGGIRLLSVTARNAQDPQTLRMVAGAIANLCGNDKLQTKLRGEGGIRALVGMVRCKHSDVLAQVARGIANFAKCESRAYIQGTKSGRSLLIEDGAMPWIIQNASNETSHIRRHIELALCHIAQHEVNAKDMVSGGALWELVRISRNCSREDIRTLAYHTLTSSKSFQAELKRLRVDYG